MVCGRGSPLAVIIFAFLFYLLHPAQPFPVVWFLGNVIVTPDSGSLGQIAPRRKLGSGR